MKTTLVSLLFLFASPAFAQVVRVPPDTEREKVQAGSGSKENAKSSEKTSRTESSKNDARTESSKNEGSKEGARKGESANAEPKSEASKVEVARSGSAPPEAPLDAPPKDESSPELANLEGEEEASVAATALSDERGKKKKKKKIPKADPEKEDPSEPRVILAPAEPPAPPVDPETRPFSHHLGRWELALGGSMLWADSSGLDYFAETDVLSRFHARIARSFRLGERLSLAISPEWNVIGSADDGARTNHSSLRMSEFSLGLELRYFLSTRFAGYVRVSPGGTHTQAELGNGAALLAHDSLHFHADLSAGMLARLVGAPNGEEAGLRLHGYFEAGYDWMPSRTLSLSAKSAPERTEPFEVKDLSLSAPHVGVGLLLSY